jgi:hypothetical protein
MARVKWALKGLMMPASILAHLPKALKSSKLQTTGDRWRAAVTLIRLRLLRMLWMLRQAVGLDI